MAQFKITAVKPETRETRVFLYDNMTSALIDEETGKSAIPLMDNVAPRSPIVAVSRENPGRKITPKTLKISLGLSCNYECEYCSQRYQPRAEETNPGDVTAFVEGLDSWVKTPPETVEFWGGEPLVYIKTLRPLAEAIRAKWPDIPFTLITNGSLLNPELNEWIDRMGFCVGLSHDGPGQSVRGPDPLDDPEQKAAILDLYRRLRPQHRMSFNSVLNSANQSRSAIVDFFVALTGDPTVPIGEGMMVDAYNEGGEATSLRPEQFVSYRRQAFNDIRSGKAANFDLVKQKVSFLINGFRTSRPASVLGQKCSMDRPENIAVDLRGNVMTCQNAGTVGVAPNGESHTIGHVSNLAEVALTTATHWSHRDECPKCPMLHSCQGACMFLEGPLWETTCNNAFSDAVPIFAAAIDFLTGYVPVRIEGPHRADRHDLWAEPAEPARRRVIPIAKVAA